MAEQSDERDPLLKKGEVSPCLGDATVRVRILTCLTSLAEGYDLSCIAGAVVLFKNDLDLDAYEIGWIMGSTYVAMAFGAVLVGGIMDTIGRKPSLGAAYVLMAVGSCLMAFANGFYQMMLGRTLLGAGIGMGLSAVSSYIAEVAPAQHRGLFSSLEEVFIVLGIVAGYSGNYLLYGYSNDWRWMLGLGAVAPTIFAILLLTPLFPESPRFLLLNGRADEAESVLSSLVEEQEVQSILQKWQAHQTPKPWKEVLLPESSVRRRALAAGVGICFCQLLSGVHIIASYIPMLLAKDSTMDIHTMFLNTLLVGAARVIVLMFVMFFLVDHWGRRPLLLTSAAGIVLAHFYFVAAYSFQWALVPWKLLGFYIFMVFFELGLGPVVYTYVGECFDNEVRSKGVSIGLFGSRIFGGFIMFLFPVIQQTRAGTSGCFLVLGILNLGGLAFIYHCIPETKMMSLETVHEVFGGCAAAA